MSAKNNLWKTSVTVILTIFVIVALVRHFRIKNFKTVIPGVLYTSGQPEGMDYTRLLYKHRIKTFINVRKSSESRRESWYNQEQSWMDENDVNYIEMPVSKHDILKPLLDRDLQNSFLTVMENENNWPVLIHGNSGTRRPAILAGLWLIKKQGYSLDKAVFESERIRERKLDAAEQAFLKDLTE